MYVNTFELKTMKMKLKNFYKNIFFIFLSDEKKIKNTRELVTRNRFKNLRTKSEMGFGGGCRIVIKKNFGGRFLHS